MGALDELRALFKNVLGQYEPQRTRDRGLLGRGDTAQTLYVAGDADGRVWFRKNGQASQATPVHCHRVRPVYGMPVICGTVSEQPALYQVLTWDREALEFQWSGMAQVPPHAEMHMWEHDEGGDDPVMVWTRAFMPFRVSPQDTPDLTVQIEGPEMYYWQTGWQAWPGDDSVDLTANVPGAGTHRYCLISIDGATATAQTTCVAAIADVIPLGPGSYPTPPTGSIPVGLIYLYGGQTEITEDEIVDARMMVGPGYGSMTPTAHHLIDSTVHDDADTYGAPAQGDVIRFDTDWERLAIGGAHLIFKVNAGGTLPIWAAFVWADIAAAAGADVVHDHSAAGEGGQLDWDDVWSDAVHDHSSAAEGGDDLNPETITPQTFIVGPSPAPYDTLGEAVTAVNAFGPTAANPAVIKVMGIVTSEAGAVTIPSYCDLVAQGEGSVIGMGGSQLDFASHSSALDIVVTSSHLTAGLSVWAVTDVELRNVKSISTGGGDCFYIDSADAELYNCRGECTGGAANAFSIIGTSDALLEDCIGTEGTLRGLNLAGTAQATTRYCAFKGSTKDVQTAAGTTWTYHQDDFDPDNCTVAGTADPADGQEVIYFPCTKTVTTDFATIQAAVDWFKNRLLCAACKIDIDTGATYNEEVVIEDVFCTAEGRLELEGDTRGMAGATWVDNAAITCQDANAGSGVCTLANAGAVITVTGAGGNPDFDADGWGNGDTVITRDNAGAIATYTISATLNNTITLTVAAPALGNTGTSLTLVPDTVIAPSGAGHAVEVIESRGIVLDGLSLDATAGATGHGLYVHDGGGCKCENVLAEADDDGFLADWGAFIMADDGACTAIECTIGFYAPDEAYILADYGVAVGCSSGGLYAAYTGYVEADYAVATDCSTGFAGAWLGGIKCTYAYAYQNTTYGFWATRQGFNRCNNSRTAATNGTDYRADYNAYMYAANTNVGGPTYSPAVSDTEGNVYAIITFS